MTNKLLILFISAFFGAQQLVCAQLACADFGFTEDSIYIGETVTFTNLSRTSCEECGSRFMASHYEWSLPGGIPYRALGRGPVQVTLNDTIGTYYYALEVVYIDIEDLDVTCIKKMVKEIKVHPRKDIEFKSFFTESAGNKIDVKWTMLHERNNKSFTIERSSDNVNFTEFGQLEKYTHSHTNGDWLPCKVPTSSSGAIGG